MPETVFLTGATGYLGAAAARALQAAGYAILGLARSDESARKLAAAGCAVQRGTLADPSGLAAGARAADAVVHAAMQWGPEAGALDAAAVDAMLDALAGSGKTFLYTSGAWVFGPTRGRVIGETAPLRPPPVVAWRPAVERRVQDAVERRVRTIILRPGTVYGGAAGLIANAIREAREQGVLYYAGDGENHVPLVHIDDLADLYVRALERAGAGEVYIATNGEMVKARDLWSAAARAGGGRAESLPIGKARERWGPMADAMTMDQRIASTKAGRQLGWFPKSRRALDELGS
jgi:nucleoside-diphosphate-sugar epimerase